jgi:hypothetical protein
LVTFLPRRRPEIVNPLNIGAFSAVFRLLRRPIFI